VRELSRISADQRHIAETIGVTRLADVTGLDDIGIPVFLGIRPTSRSLVVSAGKGLDPVAARTAALMESAEVWHAENIRPAVESRTAEELRLRGNVVVDLAGLPVEADLSADLDAATDWLAGVDLNTGGSVLVPVEAVSMDFTERQRSRLGIARSSNGLAAGRSFDDAVLHGLCEVLERDAEFTWRLSEDSRRIDLNTVTDPACREMLARIARAGAELGVWEVSSAVGVPCVCAIVADDPDRPGSSATGVYEGFACHPDPSRALAAAIAEAVQKRLTYIAGSRDDLSHAEMAGARNAVLVKNVVEQLRTEPSTVDFGGVPAVPGDSTSTWVHAIAARLEQVVVVDLTRAELGVPVAAVCVPWLQGPFGLCAPLPPGRSAALRWREVLR
jgi:YcaO-like protein with predicted kinase domain